MSHIYAEQWHERTLPDGQKLRWVTGWVDFGSYLADQRNPKASAQKQWCQNSRVETASTPRFVDHSAKKVA